MWAGSGSISWLARFKKAFFPNALYKDRITANCNTCRDRVLSTSDRPMMVLQVWIKCESGVFCFCEFTLLWYWCNCVVNQVRRWCEMCDSGVNQLWMGSSHLDSQKAEVHGHNCHNVFLQPVTECLFTALQQQTEVTKKNITKHKKIQSQTSGHLIVGTVSCPKQWGLCCVQVLRDIQTLCTPGRLVYTFRPAETGTGKDAQRLIQTQADEVRVLKPIGGTRSAAAFRLSTAKQSMDQ